MNINSFLAMSSRRQFRE